MMRAQPESNLQGFSRRRFSTRDHCHMSPEYFSYISRHQGMPASRRKGCRAPGRMALAGLAVLALAGCSLSKTTFSIPNGQVSDINCRAVALNRASDAGDMGEDSQTQSSVFERTYVDCVSWHQTH
jgi:hypothetical protein